MAISSRPRRSRGGLELHTQLGDVAEYPVERHPVVPADSEQQRGIVEADVRHRFAALGAPGGRPAPQARWCHDPASSELEASRSARRTTSRDLPEETPDGASMTSGATTVPGSW